MQINDIKKALTEIGVRPSKRLGQNFLIDENIKKKIIGGVEASKDDIILEIGPGLGSLTHDLCKHASKVIAIEKDRRLYNHLLQSHRLKNLRLIHGDILKYEFKGVRIKVVGNLPYYISSPIIIHLLNNRDSISSVFITVQQEFAERIVARPGTRQYGSITCLIQFYAEPAILFKINKKAFYPPPEVDSCFLRLYFRKRPLYLTDEKKLFKIIRICFEQRRKTILNSLYSSGDFGAKEDIVAKLKKAGIDPGLRPEVLSLDTFVRVSEHIYGY